MRLPPGSFLWLVAHDLRLSARRFRGLFGKLHGATIVLVVAAAMILFHLLAWPVADWLGSSRRRRQARRVLLSGARLGDDLRHAMARLAGVERHHAGALYPRRSRSAPCFAAAGALDFPGPGARHRHRIGEFGGDLPAAARRHEHSDGPLALARALSRALRLRTFRDRDRPGPGHGAFRFGGSAPHAAPGADRRDVDRRGFRARAAGAPCSCPLRSATLSSRV